jgi:phosphate transport system substrate-binding protein
MRKKHLLLLLLSICLSDAIAQYRVVGSSTLFPVLSAVADHFTFRSLGVAPIIESTGTGSGIKLFCSKKDSPFMVSASRPIAPHERETCKQNGRTDLLEIEIAYEGMVLATSKKENSISLSLDDLQKALDPNSVHITKWSHIKSQLPEKAIKILGPSSTSGAYESILHILGLKSLRRDGVYISASDQESVLAQKLRVEPDSYGLISFGFLKKNPTILFSCAINGQYPSKENIKIETYDLSRKLYVYIDKNYIKLNKQASLFIDFLLSNKVNSDQGILDDFGLVSRR